MAKLETNDSYAEDEIWMCECHNGYLKATWEHEPREGWLTIEHHNRTPSMRERINLAFRVLKGYDEPSSDVIFRKAQIDSFSQWLLSKVDQ
jgi:hypothetical protein